MLRGSEWVKNSNIVVILFLCLSWIVCKAQTQHPPKYLDPSLPIEQRIDDLVPRLTLEEKIQQISDDWGSKAIPRLKIPSLLKTEGLHSQSYSTGATIFPMPIAMAATFDIDLISSVGHQTAIESKAAHIRASWSPVLDVSRDVRWGRTEETYGESPYLVSQIGKAWINGFQGEGMIAIPKHFAGHGAPEGGRDSQDIGLSNRVMREIHLPSFRTAIEEAHAGGIMAAYGTWNGVPNNASPSLLQGILRQEWGFDGFIVSDCGAPEHFIHKHAIAKTPAEAAALAIRAGVNMECGTIYKAGIAAAMQQGLITEGQLDGAVRPIIRAKFKLGLFERPEPDSMVWEKLPEYDKPEARRLARRVETEGAVLLRNEHHLLPLDKNPKVIAVIGPDADMAQVGDYSPKLSPLQAITVLQAIKTHVGVATEVVFANGLPSPTSTDTSKFAEAEAAARRADIAIVVVGDESRPGERESTSGEDQDGATLNFPGAQRDLIRAVESTGTPVVLVIVNGKPFTLAWEAEHIPAILVTWYPGEEGGNATADLLFGVENPSGRLPITWPRHPGQLPLHYDYHPSGRRYDYFDMPFSPQFRFGYGLSYTQFKYSNLQIHPKADDPGFVDISVDIENTGKYDGDEVVQLYLADVVASVSTPVIELQGFKRVSLRAGDKKTINFELTPYQLSLLDANMIRRVESGSFRIHVGGVSPDLSGDVIDDRKAKIEFKSSDEGVSGEFTEPREYRANFKCTLEISKRMNAGQLLLATVTVKNEGNLTDVTEAKLYAGTLLDCWRFELRPGETKSHVFQVVRPDASQIAVVAGTQMIVKTVKTGTAK
jgi:beta-glucosidase